VSLSPEALARLSKLHLRTKVIVDGFLSGRHRSPTRGQSVEFAEHKEYSPGDEVKHIDWKAYGKLDRYYVRRFEQETNLTAYVVLDASRSMAYGDAGSKYELASVLAASLAVVLTRQQDRVGLAVWHDAAAGRRAGDREREKQCSAAGARCLRSRRYEPLPVNRDRRALG
jgi:uncharacterized protein (DUF58 family)